MYGHVDPCRAFADFRAQRQAPEISEPRQLTAFETYLSLRAYGHQTPCWADKLGGLALIKSSTALGVLISRGSDGQTNHISEDETLDLADIGFGIILQGPPSLRECREGIRSKRWFGLSEQVPGVS